MGFPENELLRELRVNGYDFPLMDIPRLLECLSSSEKCVLSAPLEADDFLASMRKDGLIRVAPK